jgi:MtN3 and saliva related transmembrane protein
MTMLGLLAGLLTTACWVPQVWRSWRTRSTGDLSWTYLAVLSIGVAMWLAYGVGLGDPAIMAANALTLVSLSLLTVLKLRTAGLKGRSRQEPAEAA